MEEDWALVGRCFEGSRLDFLPLERPFVFCVRRGTLPIPGRRNPHLRRLLRFRRRCLCSVKVGIVEIGDFGI